MADDKPEQPAKDASVPTVQHNGETLEVWGDAPEKMRKGIQLLVTLHIEGDAPPAANFSKSTIEAVHDIIAAGSSKHPELTVTIKQVAEK